MKVTCTLFKFRSECIKMKATNESKMNIGPWNQRLYDELVEFRRKPEHKAFVELPDGQFSIVFQAAAAGKEIKSAGVFAFSSNLADKKNGEKLEAEMERLTHGLPSHDATHDASSVAFLKIYLGHLHRYEHVKYEGYELTGAAAMGKKIPSYQEFQAREIPIIEYELKKSAIFQAEPPKEAVHITPKVKAPTEGVQSAAATPPVSKGYLNGFLHLMKGVFSKMRSFFTKQRSHSITVDKNFQPVKVGRNSDQMVKEVISEVGDDWRLLSNDGSAEEATQMIKTAVEDHCVKVKADDEPKVITAIAEKVQDAMYNKLWGCCGKGISLKGRGHFGFFKEPLSPESLRQTIQAAVTPAAVLRV